MDLRYLANRSKDRRFDHGGQAPATSLLIQVRTFIITPFNEQCFIAYRAPDSGDSGMLVAWGRHDIDVGRILAPEDECSTLTVLIDMLSLLEDM